MPYLTSGRKYYASKTKLETKINELNGRIDNIAHEGGGETPGTLYIISPEPPENKDVFWIKKE